MATVHEKVNEAYDAVVLEIEILDDNLLKAECQMAELDGEIFGLREALKKLQAAKDALFQLMKKPE